MNIGLSEILLIIADILLLLLVVFAIPRRP